jgi:hypothetical protein
MNTILVKSILEASEKGFDEVGQIIAYESGELSEDEIIDLFQHLVDNGHAWSLQGSYGRMAKRLIDQGLITRRS